MIGAGAIALTAAPAGAGTNPRYAGFVIDANNGQVLYEDRADEYRYPASLTKMMTLYLTFDALSRKRIGLNDDMPVSKYAAGRPPTKVGVPAGRTLKVEEAIYALVTRSANDASVTLAEYLAGSESAFAEMMTRTARKLGMNHTTYRNANGLPNSEQRTTARDQAKLGIALREHFPQYYKYFSTRSYNFRGRRLGNHNRVLGRMDGVDGIKTGYINASGFNLVTSIKRDGKSLVGVVMGGRSGRSRDDHMIKIIQEALPKASRRDSGPLIAARPETRSGVAAVLTAEIDLPKRGPVPDLRPGGAMSADQRIAMAYDTAVAREVGAVPQPASRPLRGRDALRAALVGDTAPHQILMPTASTNALVGPTPVPGNRQIDPTFTGAIRAVATPVSPWVVQIAATPDVATAMDLLETAKRKVGGLLASAQPFTEPVSKGDGTLHRARFAGFATKDQAWSACEALKRVNYACYAVAN